MQTGIEALAHGGTFALVGMGADCCPVFPMHTFVSKEADFRGCFRYTNIVRPPLISECSLKMLLSSALSLGNLDGLLALQPLRLLRHVNRVLYAEQKP